MIFHRIFVPLCFLLLLMAVKSLQGNPMLPRKQTWRMDSVPRTLRASSDQSKTSDAFHANDKPQRRERRGLAVDGNWNRWYKASLCSADCGEGQILWSRMCDYPEPVNGGKYCEGERNRYEHCWGKKCPVDGGFSKWVPAAPCFGDCTDATQDFIRICDNPAPRYGGKSCTGKGFERRLCMPNSCTPDGKDIIPTGDEIVIQIQTVRTHGDLMKKDGYFNHKMHLHLRSSMFAVSKAKRYSVVIIGAVVLILFFNILAYGGIYVPLLCSWKKRIQHEENDKNISGGEQEVKSGSSSESSSESNESKTDSEQSEYEDYSYEGSKKSKGDKYKKQDYEDYTYEDPKESKKDKVKKQDSEYEDYTYEDPEKSKGNKVKKQDSDYEDYTYEDPEKSKGDKVKKQDSEYEDYTYEDPKKSKGDKIKKQDSEYEDYTYEDPKEPKKDKVKKQDSDYEDYTYEDPKKSKGDKIKKQDSEYEDYTYEDPKKSKGDKVKNQDSDYEDYTYEDPKKSKGDKVKKQDSEYEDYTYEDPKKSKGDKVKKQDSEYEDYTYDDPKKSKGDKIKKQDSEYEDYTYEDPKKSKGDKVKKQDSEYEDYTYEDPKKSKGDKVKKQDSEYEDYTYEDTKKSKGDKVKKQDSEYEDYTYEDPKKSKGNKVKKQDSEYEDYTYEDPKKLKVDKIKKQDSDYYDYYNHDYLVKGDNKTSNHDEFNQSNKDNVNETKRNSAYQVKIENSIDTKTSLENEKRKVVEPNNGKEMEVAENSQSRSKIAKSLHEGDKPKEKKTYEDITVKEMVRDCNQSQQSQKDNPLNIRKTSKYEIYDTTKKLNKLGRNAKEVAILTPEKEDRNAQKNIEENSEYRTKVLDIDDNYGKSKREGTNYDYYGSEDRKRKEDKNKGEISYHRSEEYSKEKQVDVRSGLKPKNLSGNTPALHPSTKIRFDNGAGNYIEIQLGSEQNQDMKIKCKENDSKIEGRNEKSKQIQEPLSKSKLYPSQDTDVKPIEDNSKFFEVGPDYSESFSDQLFYKDKIDNTSSQSKHTENPSYTGLINDNELYESLQSNIQNDFDQIQQKNKARLFLTEEPIYEPLRDNTPNNFDQPPIHFTNHLGSKKCLNVMNNNNVFMEGDMLYEPIQNTKQAGLNDLQVSPFSKSKPPYKPAMKKDDVNKQSPYFTKTKNQNSIEEDSLYEPLQENTENGFNNQQISISPAEKFSTGRNDRCFNEKQQHNARKDNATFPDNESLYQLLQTAQHNEFHQQTHFADHTNKQMCPQNNMLNFDEQIYEPLHNNTRKGHDSPQIPSFGTNHLIKNKPSALKENNQISIEEDSLYETLQEDSGNGFNNQKLSIPQTKAFSAGRNDVCLSGKQQHNATKGNATFPDDESLYQPLQTTQHSAFPQQTHSAEHTNKQRSPQSVMLSFDEQNYEPLQNERGRNFEIQQMRHKDASRKHRHFEDKSSIGSKYDNAASDMYFPINDNAMHRCKEELYEHLQYDMNESSQAHSKSRNKVFNKNDNDNLNEPKYFKEKPSEYYPSSSISDDELYHKNIRKRPGKPRRGYTEVYFPEPKNSNSREKCNNESIDQNLVRGNASSKRHSGKKREKLNSTYTEVYFDPLLKEEIQLDSQTNKQQTATISTMTSIQNNDNLQGGHKALHNQTQNRENFNSKASAYTQVYFQPEVKADTHRNVYQQMTICYPEKSSKDTNIKMVKNDSAYTQVDFKPEDEYENSGAKSNTHRNVYQQNLNHDRALTQGSLNNVIKQEEPAIRGSTKPRLVSGKVVKESSNDRSLTQGSLNNMIKQEEPPMRGSTKPRLVFGKVVQEPSNDHSLRQGSLNNMIQKEEPSVRGSTKPRLVSGKVVQESSNDRSITQGSLDNMIQQEELAIRGSTKPRLVSAKVVQEPSNDHSFTQGSLNNMIRQEEPAIRGSTKPRLVSGKVVQEPSNDRSLRQGSLNNMIQKEEPSVRGSTKPRLVSGKVVQEFSNDRSITQGSLNNMIKQEEPPMRGGTKPRLVSGKVVQESSNDPSFTQGSLNNMIKQEEPPMRGGTKPRLVSSKVVKESSNDRSITQGSLNNGIQQDEPAIRGSTKPRLVSGKVVQESSNDHSITQGSLNNLIQQEEPAIRGSTKPRLVSGKVVQESSNDHSFTQGSLDNVFQQEEPAIRGSTKPRLVSGKVVQESSNDRSITQGSLDNVFQQEEPAIRGSTKPRLVSGKVVQESSNDRAFAGSNKTTINKHKLQSGNFVHRSFSDEAFTQNPYQPDNSALRFNNASRKIFSKTGNVFEDSNYKNDDSNVNNARKESPNSTGLTKRVKTQQNPARIGLIKANSFPIGPESKEKHDTVVNLVKQKNLELKTEIRREVGIVKKIAQGRHGGNGESNSHRKNVVEKSKKAESANTNSGYSDSIHHALRYPPH